MPACAGTRQPAEKTIYPSYYRILALKISFLIKYLILGFIKGCQQTGVDTLKNLIYSFLSLKFFSQVTPLKSFYLKKGARLFLKFPPLFKAARI